MHVVTIEQCQKPIGGDVFQKTIDLIEFTTGIQFTAGQRDRVFNKIRGGKRFAILCHNSHERDYVVGVLNSTYGIKEYKIDIVDLFSDEWTF